MQSPAIPRVPEARDITGTLATDGVKGGDIFESVDETEQHAQSTASPAKQAEPESPATFDHLPIEIRSLTER